MYIPGRNFDSDAGVRRTDLFSFKIIVNDHKGSSLDPQWIHLSFKKRSDGTLDKSIVLYKLCKKEFACDQIDMTLKYNLKAEHVGASTDVPDANVNIYFYIISNH